ncbi:MAG TPA: protein kinase, partial [Ktedonobacteraceae bacterium]|nr:protein kinase [Ktedonobacteraceae bacterium]
MVDRAGERFADYRLVRRLGGGTFGDVYLSEHLNDQTPAAIKILQARLVNNEDLKDFINEVSILFRLQHPNIVPLKNFGIEHDVAFLVMDYAAGGTLRQPRGQRLPLDVVVSYTGQIAAALQYAHDRKLIHRDVKPDNLLLGSTNQVWLSDFGIASIAHSSRSLNTQEGAGTIAYMAPEQIMGKPRPASDQYALGIIVYEWLSGQRPFTGTSTEVAIQHTQAPPPSLREKVPTLSPAVEEVVMTALAKEPHQRFASVQAFARALEQASQPEAPVLPPISNRVTPVLQEQPASPSPARSTIELVSHSPTEPVVPQTDPPFPQKELTSTPPILGTTSAPANLLGRVPAKRNRTLILAILLLLVTASSVIVYFPIAAHNAAEQQATATAGATFTYNEAVAASGIMFGFNAQRTGYNPYEKVIDPHNVSDLVQDWTSATGNFVFSSPAVANGVVYVGSNDHKLYAFTAAGCGHATCTPLWTATTGGVIESSPAVVNGVVYVGS